MAESEEKIIPIGRQRTLAVIVFTDVVGYSSQMAKNENLTLDLVRRDLTWISKLCQDNGGQILKNTGDGLLMYFNSAHGAMTCSLTVQEKLNSIWENSPPGRALQHRIGVHLGDVFMVDHDIMGDGVNVAARVMTLADPNGICFTGSVYDLIEKILPGEPDFLGTPPMKNIDRKIPVYRLSSRLKNKFAPPSPAAAPVPTVASKGTSLAGTEDGELSPLAKNVLARIKGNITKPGSVICLDKCVEMVKLLSDDANPSGMDAIADAIMKDPFLTTRVLTVSNSAYYNRSFRNISTVSQAIMVLGLNELRSIIFSVLVLEQLPDQNRATVIRNRSASSALGGSLAKTMAIELKVNRQESAFLAGAFSQFGKLLIYAFVPDLADQFDKLVIQHQINEEEAAEKIFGMRIEALGKQVGCFLSLPKAVTAHMDPLHMTEEDARYAGDLAPIAHASMEICRIAEHARSSSEMMESLQSCHALKKAGLAHLDFLRVFQQSISSIESVYLPSQAPFMKKVKKIHDEIELKLNAFDAMAQRGGILQIKKGTALQIFQEGAAAVVNLMGDAGCSWKTVLMAICETFFYALNARNVFVAVKNPSKDALLAEIGLGDQFLQMQKCFSLSLNSRPPLLPNVCLNTNKEIYVENIQGSQFFNSVPDWVKEVSPKSVLFFPVVDGGMRVAMIFADGEKLFSSGQIPIDVRMEMEKLKSYTAWTLAKAGQD